MSHIFTTLLYQPIFNLLIAIYNTIAFHDFGFALVILTVGIRLIFTPLSIKTTLSQRALNKLQPKIKELNEKHKNDRTALSQATMALYKEHKVNPLSGCLPLLIQLPVLIALYQALNGVFKAENFSLLYSFVENPGMIKEIAFGFINIAHKSPVLAVTAGVLQWVQARQSIANQGNSMNKDAMASAMNKQMLYFFPIMVIIISWNLPTGIVIYWITATLFSLAEQLYIGYKYRNV